MGLIWSLNFPMHLQRLMPQVSHKGAIQLLDAARCSAFCFGSEEGDIQPFENSHSLIEQAGG